MMRQRFQKACPRIGARARGFTLVEAAISTVLVSGLLVASLNTLGSAKLGQQKITQHVQAHLLAEELLSEIMRQDYADPEDVGSIDLSQLTTPAALGPESDESTGDRTLFDDVDDYDGWNAKPPADKQAIRKNSLPGWSRAVIVERVTMADPATTTNLEQGLKRITVTVAFDGNPVIQLVGLKGAGLPAAPTGPRILMVVNDIASLNAQEIARVTLLESWSYTVDLVAASDTQANINAAADKADVIYVTTEVDAGALGTKLRLTDKGVVNEMPHLADEFGICGKAGSAWNTVLRILDNTHAITSDFPMGDGIFLTSPDWLFLINGSYSSDLIYLTSVPKGKQQSFVSMVALDDGMSMYNGGTTNGRRVQTSWSWIGFDINSLTVDGQTLLRNSLEWAQGGDPAAQAQ